MDEKTTTTKEPKPTTPICDHQWEKDLFDMGRDTYRIVTYCTLCEATKDSSPG
jgi:hypothetical protein